MTCTAAKIQALFGLPFAMPIRSLFAHAAKSRMGEDSVTPTPTLAY